MQPKSYSLRVVASDPTTNERVILRGYFTIAGKKESADEKDFCGVTIVNKGTEVKHDEVTVEFTGTEAVMSFECRLAGGQNQPCTYTCAFITGCLLLCGVCVCVCVCVCYHL